MSVTLPHSNALTPLTALGSAETFARKERLRQRLTLFYGVVVAIAAACSFALTGIDSLIVPLILLLLIVIPILLWRLPRLALYVVFSSACLFELGQSPYADALTDRVPFFWNVNTIFQTYAHVNFKAVPLNLFECFILLAGICSLLRAVFTKTLSIQGGPLLWPILLYLFWVAVAWANGMATQGDFKISLQETRAQFYFLFGYLMAYNLIRTKRQVNTLVWTTIICLAIKGLLYTFRRYVTLAGQPTPDQGVGSHEEAFFFDAFVLWFLCALVCGVHPKMRLFMLTVMPAIILGNIACNRRAATAAMALMVPVVLIAAFQGLPQRRRLAGILSLLLVTIGPLYYQAFKNSDSAIAQPARAIKSQFQPDDRDLSSNMYRDAENADQMATIKAYPLGYGYGKRFIHAVTIADISDLYEWWDILPHNQILWVWMRTGTQGFLCFWIMIAAIIMYAGMVFRDKEIDMEMRTIALFSILVVGLLLVFGLLDLQMSNYRDMLFAAIWVGVMARARDFRALPTKISVPVVVGKKKTVAR